MDVRHAHDTDIYAVRACPHEDGADLVAIGGAHSVEVLLVTPTSSKLIANFHVGTRITTLAWSSKVASPSMSDAWSVEIAAAGENFGLFLLTKSAKSMEYVFSFGGGLSGHHGKVNDMCFCGGQGEDSARYLATVSDDKMLMVWDLTPDIDIPSLGSPDPNTELTSEFDRPQPTALVSPFPYPLTSVTSHPTTSKELLVADCRGSIFLTDWRKDPDENAFESWRGASIVELVDPRAFVDTSMGISAKSPGSVSWRRDRPNIIGASYGTTFSIWDLTDLHGGKPNITGVSFPDGSAQFKWCPTYPDYFAISSRSPTKGAVIHVHNIQNPHGPLASFSMANGPLYVRAFDFLAARGVPRIAAAVGRQVVILYIGDES
ncbi:predicted protein [Postia placenta Mad-698-R]|uniref:WD40 repeat-like protein n=1 Tax=Postia placenta MAD-698-R-SB12 TaxID=670580 RepID=A0A1X6N7V9_9APHY|nr:hypothetical protein POSPLADRAFT_1053512 [Postia placenta MAD-698-R-SB12]EED83928.1 predicted protein [Postia placenta Mad-698-R]OSX64715.1 hypothetical protein POSPLADRAFT_1053512 [Postia placenta MAD-698-R-SB12]